MIELAFEETENLNVSGVSLKVIGVGGGGGNAINSMIASNELTNVIFMAANTDAQALNMSAAPTKLQIGKKITKGLGAGSNPEVGRRAAEEDLAVITEQLNNTDILFLTGGLGGGTASGALPVIASAAKALGILTIAVVTKPFAFEGKRRLKQAEDAYNNLKNNVDTLLAVPNQKLLEIVDPKISMLNAFALSNDILKQAIKGISDIITKAGHINVDFADVKTIMTSTGIAIMGTGRAVGPDRARQAALKAINSPLLENANINGAKGVLLNISGNEKLELQEINDAASLIYDLVSPDANIILGSVIDPTMDEEISVTVIATGLEEQPVSAKTVASAAAQVAKVTAVTAEQPAVEAPVAEQVATSEVTASEVTAIEAEAPTVVPEATQAVNQLMQDLAPENQLTPAAAPAESFDLNDFDTPTFMRKKAQEQKQTLDS
jgi:cell division protein FtsZ